ncbi:MAG TPA: GDCCVxC domain-containing (seleno)protein [Caulobacteraceae bacterium]|nr:GDCCVxC domain-containing (seleno)protein [Caulobacteraceae bacterium]
MPALPQLISTLTCPWCGARWRETMPANACAIACDCRACGAQLRPLAGRCCVFCSYGDVPCPPAQPSRGPAPERDDDRC